MISGIILGIVTWLSFALSWYHAPHFIKKMSMRLPLVTDLIGASLAYVLISSISKSIIAVIGAITCGLLISTSILIGKDYYNSDRKT